MEKALRLEEKLLILFILIIAILIVFIFLNPGSVLISQILPYIAIIPVLISICFLERQSKFTEKAVEATSRPHICVGIMSFKNLNDKIFVDPTNESLENTRIIIKNFSNFPAFVWTKIKLKINEKEENEHIKIKDYCSGTAVWELDPNEILHPFILNESILDYKNQGINISIIIYFSHIRKLPKNPDWIELTAYSFRKNGQWLKNNLGVPFFIQGLFINNK